MWSSGTAVAVCAQRSLSALAFTDEIHAQLLSGASGSFWSNFISLLYSFCPSIVPYRTCLLGCPYWQHRYGAPRCLNLSYIHTASHLLWTMTYPSLLNFDLTKIVLSIRSLKKNVTSYSKHSLLTTVLSHYHTNHDIATCSHFAMAFSGHDDLSLTPEVNCSYTQLNTPTSPSYMPCTRYVKREPIFITGP